MFALLGSHGAGKTTAVKILCTLPKADGGTATVNGLEERGWTGWTNSRRSDLLEGRR